MGSILGVDVGGTFTDFIHVGEDGRIDIVKTPSTPSEPAQGVLDGLKKLAGSEMSLSEFLDGIDLFSLDIDGIDYWILKELPIGFCKILVVEYNPYFGSEFKITVPNIKNFNRTKSIRR